MNREVLVGQSEVGAFVAAASRWLGPMGRLGVLGLAALLFLGVLFPWSPGHALIEANFWRGPLVLFLVRAPEDRLIGGVVAAVLALLIFLVVVRLNRLTVAASLVGLLAWFGLGIWVAAGAAR